MGSSPSPSGVNDGQYPSNEQLRQSTRTRLTKLIPSTATNGQLDLHADKGDFIWTKLLLVKVLLCPLCLGMKSYIPYS